MRRTRSRRRSHRHLLEDLEDLLIPARHATIAGLAWSWRYELALLTGPPLAMMGLIHILGMALALTSASALVGVFGPWPPRHQLYIAHAWRIITPHRVRAGCAQARIQSRTGRLPTILRTTREPFGERLTIWCPAGTSAGDFRSARTILAAACWAADIRIERNERHAQLLTLDVIRYRPCRR
jgi:hypothetical protein